MMLRAADPLAAQDVSMPIDNALKQRRVVIEGRSANSGPLRLFVPQPDLHGFVVERVSAEGCNLLGIHRSTLKRKRVDRSAGQLAEIGGIGRAEIAFGGDMQPDAFNHDRRKERYKQPRALIVVVAVFGIARRIGAERAREMSDVVKKS